MYLNHSNDLLLIPERYSFPDVSAKDYFQRYLKNREQAIDKFKLKEGAGEAKTTNTALNSAILSEQRIEELVKRFEVKKCFIAINTDHDYLENVIQTLWLGRSILCKTTMNTINFQWLSTLLKLGDVLSSVSRINLLSVRECQLIVSYLEDEIELMRGYSLEVLSD